MRVSRIAAAAFLAALALAGCSSKGGVGDQAGAYPTAGRRPGAGGAGRYGPEGAYGEPGYGAGGRGARAGEGLDAPAQRVIYFLYDSDEILPEYQSIVSANAEYLAANPARSAVLQGHADERGSPEYNIALGERRAKAVLRVMQLKGVGDNQVQVVSFGEEKPADEGHDESAWDRNRRVEISYSDR
jgi:peptidoglycan-associated lipoprotein